MKSRKLAYEAIGTHWDLQVGESVDESTWQTLIQAIDARTAAFDQTYSRFRADSLVTTMSQQAGIYSLPADGYDLLQFYEKLYKATDGQVTPLIGQVLADAGYDAQYSLKQKPLTRPPEWADVITYNHRHITLSQPALLDFGAAGKGYLVDILGDLITQAGISAFTINASGDILHRSTDGQTITVGLESPLDSSEVVGIARLGNQSLCASSGSRRKWQDFHHIVNPHTLKPVHDIVATWAIANDTMTADGLATALFFTNPQELRQQFSFTYATLDTHMELSYSPDFPLQLLEVHHAA